MFWISHRGNINGRQPEMENRPEYIHEAIKAGYDVEIDVRYFPDKNEWWLGHDEAQYQIDKSFLYNPRLWCHAKTLDTLTALRQMDNVHYFSHESDSAVLSSNNFILVQPGKPYNKSCIYMMPELSKEPIVLQNLLGVCSDIVKFYRLKVE